MMAAIQSNMLSLGTIAPDFRLPDTISGKMLSLDELKSEKATVIMFICNHCPYVVYIQDQLVKLTDDYIPKGISFIAINSNDVEKYPDDHPDRMKQVALDKGYNFPFLFDETQETARAYSAACTPDFFIFDRDLKLVYRGQFDESRPNSGIAPTGEDVRNALDNIIKGNPVSQDQKPSLGCSIKWKE